jgi:hypothetical protein
MGRFGRVFPSVLPTARRALAQVGLKWSFLFNFQAQIHVEAQFVTGRRRPNPLLELAPVEPKVERDQRSVVENP